MLSHRFSQVRRQSLIPQRLDKQRRNLNLPIKNIKLFLIIDIASTIPVDCIMLAKTINLSENTYVDHESHS
jgi:hypothetical protein